VYCVRRTAFLNWVFLPSAGGGGSAVVAAADMSAAVSENVRQTFKTLIFDDAFHFPALSHISYYCENDGRPDHDFTETLERIVSSTFFFSQVLGTVQHGNGH
jgi:hypothetical protein